MNTLQENGRKKDLPPIITSPFFKSRGGLMALGLSFLSLSSGVSQAAVLINDSYDMVPTGDFGGGFGFIVTNYGGSFTFDGVSETLGTDFTGGTISINESEVDNGDGTSTITVELTTTGTDIFPTADGGGNNLTTAGWFMGATSGGDNLEFEGGSPTLVNSGHGIGGIAMGIFGFDGGGSNLWGFSLAADGSVWDGSGGFSLGSSPIGVGTTRIILEINAVNPAPVPEPSSLALLALGATGLAARRKRKAA